MYEPVLFFFQHYMAIRKWAGDTHMGFEPQCDTLHAWQVAVLDRLEQQNNRRILFVVDERGGMGKSFLVRHLLGRMGRKAWACQGGKLSDLMHAFSKQAASTELAIFDLARCIDPNWYPWGFMENLKNGWFCSTKYDGGFCMVKPDIKIVVFTNSDPPRDKLSIDRYDVYKIQ